MMKPIIPNQSQLEQHKQSEQSQRQQQGIPTQTKTTRYLAYQYNTSQLSITEQQILSHNIISEVIQKSKKKTVKQDSNKISIEARLYRSLQENVQKQFQFDTIPPRNKEFASPVSSKSIKEINMRLSEGKKLAQRLKMLETKNQGINKKEHKALAMSTDNMNKRLSLTGLITYNFNSIKSRRSLSTIPKEPEQSRLRFQVQQAKKSNSKSIDRYHKIIKRKPNSNNLKIIQIGNASVCDFYTPTNKFLRNFQKQVEKDQQTFGEKMEKLTCMKQYMQNQKTNYQETKFIVQQALTKNNVPNAKQKKKKYFWNYEETKQLQNRKKVLISAKKKIFIKHLSFTQQ